MISNDDNIIITVKKEICKVKDITELNLLKVKYLGKKGYITLQFLLLKKLNIKDRINKSVILNNQKKQIKLIIKKKLEELKFNKVNKQFIKKQIDVSLPGKSIELGTEHPLNSTINEIESFFIKLGFKIVAGYEIEDVFHNFDALNIPQNHPARTQQDTFWVNKNILLRTQTSNVQIRVMEKFSPPICILTSGKVYRNDYDHNHTPMFHQIEGLFIDKQISFINLKETLLLFLKSFFSKKCQIRFRPSYFPFTEPSLEIDIMNKKKKWIEVLGAGMIHPNVLKYVNLDSSIYSGFAFGLGVERLAMLRYNLNDIRLFFENDVRFLQQFKLNNFI
ncbi:phenylalanine--tRNA ligase subunit alpha [Enterobacteriaceae endosymbiont of Donacia tomentosa]|uniref:phenylalanine--tRNA ligase subunit alpha n=1 Tax=Enterobacteriaceae endosymbiont of Donacia tomentosa TaxID=2675787 RepID=UPI00144937FE|nr:phenylalanine--tRNA ligase subunit alpha [Enterobacteriaceae endosymbiont of Donacia tomentosa]QJC31560.1 phenylalanine--tRNA ligase subunit alpha [Enterobacteriaceae endosymbiont of Donacia tomentosa]